MVKKPTGELKVVAGTGTLVDGTVVKIDGGDTIEIDGVTYCSIGPHLANNKISPLSVFVAEKHFQQLSVPGKHYRYNVKIERVEYMNDSVVEKTESDIIIDACSTKFDIAMLLKRIDDMIKLKKGD
jgi:hypothetical protein